MPGKRYAHACAALPSTKVRLAKINIWHFQAFIVAGGRDGSNFLSSVLTLLPGAQAWTPIAALPRSLYLARASIVGGRIWVTGGQDGSSSYRSEVNIWKLPCIVDHACNRMVKMIWSSSLARCWNIDQSLRTSGPLSDNWKQREASMLSFLSAQRRCRACKVVCLIQDNVFVDLQLSSRLLLPLTVS